jgi:hypothetical protein
MSRPLKVEQLGIGERVQELAASGKSPHEIAAILKDDGYDVSSNAVSRYLANARSEVFAAISGVPRSRIFSNKNYVWFGDKQIDVSNRYAYFEQLENIDSTVSMSILSTALLLAKGFETYIDKPEDEITAEDRRVKEEIDEWAAELNLDEAIVHIAQLLLRDGTVPVYKFIDRGSIEALEFLPMRSVTLLPEGVKPGDRPPFVLKGSIETICVNESSQNDLIKYERDEVALFRFMYRGRFEEDILGRMTYGIYGKPILKSVELLIKMKWDLLDSFARMMRRYGYARLFINYYSLEDLLKEKRYKEVYEIIQKAAEDQAQLEENQDIIGTGFDIKPLTTETSVDVTEIVDMIDKYIAIGLLQTEPASGRTKGSTYASAYVTEERNLRILQSLQRQIRRTMEKEIIGHQLKLMGVETPIKIRFDPLAEPEYSLRDLSELYVNGIITLEEVRVRAGFPPEIPKLG